MDRNGIESLEATGNILFSGEEGRMTCQKVMGYFSENTHQMERLVATESVRLTHPMGKAKGDKATFYPQTATVHLTGEPQVVAQVPSHSQTDTANTNTKNVTITTNTTMRMRMIMTMITMMRMTTTTTRTRIMRNSKKTLTTSTKSTPLLRAN